MNVVFDLGAVLIGWDPRHLYRKVFKSEADMEWFLTHVCHGEWNLEQDKGRSFDDAVIEATARHPGHAALHHGDAKQAVHASHGERVVGDDEEARFGALEHCVEKVAKAFHVMVIQWCVHFVKQAKRRRIQIEDRKYQRYGRQCLLASREL